MSEALIEKCGVTSVFETKKKCLEDKGGKVVEEDDECASLVFPDGTGCTLSYLGRVDWFKAT